MRRNGTPHLATMTWSSMVSLKCCIALHMLSLEISDNTITFTSSLSRERVNMRHVSQHDVYSRSPSFCGTPGHSGAAILQAVWRSRYLSHHRMPSEVLLSATKPLRMSLTFSPLKSYLGGAEKHPQSTLWSCPCCHAKAFISNHIRLPHRVSCTVAWCPKLGSAKLTLATCMIMGLQVLSWKTCACQNLPRILRGLCCCVKLGASQHLLLQGPPRPGGRTHHQVSNSHTFLCICRLHAMSHMH